MTCGCDVPAVKKRADRNFVDIKCPRCGKVSRYLLVEKAYDEESSKLTDVLNRKLDKDYYGVH